MFASFRQSMAWVHTWFGLTIGFVLMVCFFFGSLSVFDREIDRWSIPETRFAAQPMPSFDTVLRPVFDRLKPHPDDMERTASRVIGPLPHPDTMPMQSLYAYTTHRDPVLRIGGEFGIPNKPKDPSDDHLHVHGWATIDPRTGDVLPEGRLKVGSEFFFPLHFSLNLTWMNLGYWIVGLAALTMLVGLVTGIVMHRKIFREFFTFRPWKQTLRSALDLHNLTGVVALPFHFFFALTGLIIFSAIYLPVSGTMLKALHDQHEVLEAERTGLAHEPAGIAAPLASVDAMVAEAKRRWAARDMPGEVGYLFMDHLGDRNGFVSIYRAGNDQVALVGQGVHFEAATGRVIREDPAPNAVASVQEFLTGLHLQHFRHWPLRWLYVAGGLLGCACIATGFVFFVEKRKQRHAQTGSWGARVVDSLAVTAVTGMVIAAVSILIVNRLLPTDYPDHWTVRSDLQRGAFWFAWALAALHAVLRTAATPPERLTPAWAEQCWAVAALAVAAVLLNWATTGDHLFQTLVVETYWPVAGLDLSLLATAAVAAAVALRLVRGARPRVAEPPRVAAATRTTVYTGGLDGLPAAAGAGDD